MFNLKAFAATENTNRISITAELAQISPHICLIQYSLTGALEHICWPAPDVAPQRRDELWQHTCLEAFFSDEQQAHAPYSEINISSAGNWNYYEFSAYRSGQQTPGDVFVSLKRRNSSDKAQFQIEIKSPHRALPQKYCGLSVIIEFVDGEKSYWALDHALTKPDFHDKEKVRLC